MDVARNYTAKIEGLPEERLTKGRGMRKVDRKVQQHRAVIT